MKLLPPRSTLTDTLFPYTTRFRSRFSSTTTIAKVPGVIYSLPGRVDVGTDQGAASTNTVATLNIDAGVVIFASTGNAYLAVNRGNKINAVGTSTQPILFTRHATVQAVPTDQTSGQGRGVSLLGRVQLPPSWA